MARLIPWLYSISCASLLWTIAISTKSVTGHGCDDGANCSSWDVESQEREEILAASLEMLQVSKQSTLSVQDDHRIVPTSSSQERSEKPREVAASLQRLTIAVRVEGELQMANDSFMHKEFQAVVAAKGYNATDVKKDWEKMSTTMTDKFGSKAWHGRHVDTDLHTLTYPMTVEFTFQRKASSDIRPSSNWENEQFLYHTNYRRCLHGVKDLYQDWGLYWSTAWHAKWMQDAGEMFHASRSDLGATGENLYWSSADYSMPEDVVEAWYSEVHNCWGGDWGFSPGCRSYSGVVGHFTAMIWAGASSMGCSYSPDTHYAVCRYRDTDNLDCNTPNMQGCYAQNVPPRQYNWWDCI